MKASHRLMHTQATSAPEKKSIMQAPTKRGSRSVSNEGGMAEAVLLCCKTGGGGGKQRCRRQHSLVLGAAERQIFTVVCVITGAADLWSLEFLATYIKVLSRSDVIGR